MAKADLSAARVRELLHYDPETGVFTWRVFRSGRALPGQQAAKAPRAKGYCSIFLDGYLYPAHRLAWLYMTGGWPRGHIDHKDGVRSNNRWGNLRDVTPQVNLQNQRKARVDNRCGLLGVTHHPKNDKYQARITLNKRTHSLGYHDTPEAAHEAYLEAKRRMHAGCTI